MDTAITNINAYILTGGQSRRLNMNKCLAELNGITLTEIIYKKLNPLFQNINIVGKEKHFSNYNFIEDIKPVQCPLNGIVTALEHSRNAWIFVIACDMPLINSNTILDMFDKLNPDMPIVVPYVDNDLQPLCAFYHESVLKILNNSIEKGDYSLMRLLEKIETVKHIPSEDEDQFLNINYPEDLLKAEELFNLTNGK